MIKGKIIIISGPSGVGKGTVIKAVKHFLPSVRVSVSACTRPARSYEKDGIDYYFLSKESFLQKVRRHEFIEWCEVHGNFYGTLREEIDTSIQNGNDIILEIDTQGAKKVMAQFDDAISIFIVPPSFSDLESRLQNRNTEDVSEITDRLSVAGKELSEVGEYTHVVVNNIIEKAAQDIIDILR